MNKKLIIRYTSMAVSVLLMALIFFFSSQNGNRSSEVSTGFSAVVKEIFSYILPENAVNFIVEYIRKFAHVFLYACLGASVSVCVFTYNLGHGWLYFAVPMLICLVYACSDEVHQIFVEGRDGKILDVLVDAIGFILATVIANVIRILINNKKEKGC